MLVSPGVVEASAPCAAPYSTAFCASLNSRKPNCRPLTRSCRRRRRGRGFRGRDIAALVEFAVVPENRAPVVLRRGDDAAQRGRGDLEIRKFLHGGFDHRLERVGLDVLELLSAPLTSKPSEAVKSSSLPIITSTYFAISRFTSCAFLAADGFPERRTIVQIVADDGAVFLRGLDGFDRSTSPCVSESAAKMPPVWNQRTPSLPKM